MPMQSFQLGWAKMDFSSHNDPFGIFFIPISGILICQINQTGTLEVIP